MALVKPLEEVNIFAYQKPGDRLRYIRCLSDGNLLCESRGSIAYVIAGLDLPPRLIQVRQEAYLRLKCKRCGVFYNIMIQTV